MSNYSEKSLLEQVKTLKFWKEMLVITIGMFVAAAAVYYFLMPSGIVVGSISGLSIVLSQILAGAGIVMKVSTIVTIINVILLILAYFLIGAEFGVKTAYAAIVLGPFMDIWERVMPIESIVDPALGSVMGDPWFDLLCFVLTLSASQAVLFRINASTGGLDILAKIVNKYLHFDIGTCVTIAGVVICCTAFFVNSVRMVIIGLIGTWINGIVVDYLTMSLNKRKRVCIISDESDQIRDFIINHIHRGCSLYEVKGGFSGHVREEIQVLLTQDEYVRLMGYIHEREISAFITAGNVSEVYGLWSEHKKGKED